MIFEYISRAGSLPFEQTVSQNFTSEPVWSSNLIFGIVFSGSLTLHYDMHQRDFREHDLMFFMPMQSYSVLSSSANAHILYLSIDTEYVSRLCPDFDRIQFSQNHLSCNLANPIYVNLCKNLSSIIFHNLKKEVCTQMKLLMFATQIVTILFENFGVLSRHIPTAQGTVERNSKIMEYIKEHYSEKCAVTDIADYLGLHPQYFSTYFRKQFQINYVEYLNNYRVNQSIRNLIYTDHSILDIALENGFNSHKTYSTAFKKLYQCTPAEYRQHSASAPNTDSNPSSSQKTGTDSGDNTPGTFAFFRQFIDLDRDHGTAMQLAGTLPSLAREQQIISLDASANSVKNYSSLKMTSIGRAFSCLRSDVQQQIRLAKQELNFEHLRLRDIFSDDMFVYHEDNDFRPHYNWQALDAIFDFILSIGVKPFPEIGYMPGALASKNQYSGLSYRPNTSAPKNYSRWKELIVQFLTHFIDRYGAAELRTWYFDFWTSPDLKIKDSYWHESMEDFFKFYKITYEAFCEVDSELKLGSPNFSTIYGFPWYESFFQFCYLNHLYPSYVSIHCYSSRPTRVEDEISDNFLHMHSETYTITEHDHILNNLARLHQIMNRSGFRTLEVLVPDWSLSFFPKDPIRDTCYMGPFICHILTKSLPYVKGMCFWALSDLHDEAYPESNLFTGGPGMMDSHSLKKASYNTMVLLNKLGTRILQTGENYIFTQEGSRYQILIYNLAEFDAMFSMIDHSALDESHRYQIYNEKNLYINLTVSLPSGTYYIKCSEVNRRYGSAYDLWNEIGAPRVLHKELEDYLRENSKPRVSFSVEKIEQTLLLDKEVPAHGVLLIELIPRI